MFDQLIGFTLDEGKWLTLSMVLALLGATVLLLRQRHEAVPIRRRILAAMTLFFGVTIGTMASGHLLAVTAKLVQGTLEGPVPVFYAVGVALAVPSWWLACHTRRVLDPDVDHGRATLALNTGLSLTLLALGLHNLPLAAQGFLNIAYHAHSNRVVGWSLVGVAVVANAMLFVASVVFLASGQSFEQFRGIQ